MKRLYRTEQGKMIAGVCGGIAEYCNMDPTIVRVLTVVLALVTVGFPFLIGYIICAIIIPSKSQINQ